MKSYRKAYFDELKSLTNKEFVCWDLQVRPPLNIILSEKTRR